MVRARIYAEGKPATQSGRARAGRWVLAFEGDVPQRPDPLMGWAGGADTIEQVRLVFPSREAAEAHAARLGIEAEVEPPPPRRLILRSYADNFR
ncbi:NADH dehydrogenase ubiquinone Fe-S protein 4 [Thermaurantiacus sp.]